MNSPVQSGQRQISAAHASVKRQSRLFDPVTPGRKFLFCRDGLPKSDVGRQIKQDRQIGRQIVCCESVNSFQNPPIESATESLVGHGGVGKSFADDHFPALKLRQDFFPDVLGPDGLVEKEFRLWNNRTMRRIQKELSDGLAQRGSAGFPGMDDGKSGPSQIKGDLTGLSGFPAAFGAF